MTWPPACGEGACKPVATRACTWHVTPACRAPCSARFVEALRSRFAELDLCYSVGGQISFDVFPKVGWGE